VQGRAGSAGTVLWTKAGVGGQDVAHLGYVVCADGNAHAEVDGEVDSVFLHYLHVFGVRLTQITATKRIQSNQFADILAIETTTSIVLIPT